MVDWKGMTTTKGLPTGDQRTMPRAVTYKRNNSFLDRDIFAIETKIPHGLHPNDFWCLLERIDLHLPAAVEV